MQLNLRKARKLESQIQNYLDANPVDPTASVRTLGDNSAAEEAVVTARKETLKELKEKEELLSVRYAIRRSIEKTNEECGINELLNKKVFTEKLLKIINDLDDTPAYSTEELSDQRVGYTKILDKGESGEKDFMGRRTKNSVKTSFSVPVFTEVELDDLELSKTKHKRTLEDIDDQLSVKNIAEEIIISSDNTKLLESHRLL